jgi:hypothetical protein
LLELAPKVNVGAVVGFSLELAPKVKPEVGFVSPLVVVEPNVGLDFVVVAVLPPNVKSALLGSVEL